MRASRHQTLIYQCESLQRTSASYQAGPPSSSTYDVSPQCHNNQLGMEVLVQPNICGASRTTTRQCVYPWQNSISNLPSRTRKIFSVHVPDEPLLCESVHLSCRLRGHQMQGGYYQIPPDSQLTSCCQRLLLHLFSAGTLAILPLTASECSLITQTGFM